GPVTPVPPAAPTSTPSAVCGVTGTRAVTVAPDPPGPRRAVSAATVAAVSGDGHDLRVTEAAGLRRFGVLLHARDVDQHGWLAADGPPIVTRRDIERFAGSELEFLTVVHARGETTRNHVPGVGLLTAVGARDGLDVLRPPPSRLEH